MKHVNFLKSLRALLRLNFKSIYFNFKYLEFKQAIKFPFLLSNQVYLRETRGKIKLECDVSIGIIRIGFGKIGIFDDKRSRAIWEVSGLVIFKGNADIGHGSKISVGETGILVFGNNFKITAETSIVSFKEVVFGDNCLLSWNILVMDTDFHSIKDTSGKVINEPTPILFGNNIWIGCQCLILKGSIIPNNCVIGANSLINKELKTKNALYVGNPLQLVKRDITWEP